MENPEHDTRLREHIGRHRDIMPSILAITDAEDAITEAITIVRRSLRGDCGDIALIGACTAARHRSVSWTTILAIIFEHYGVPYVLIHQGIRGCRLLLGVAALEVLIPPAHPQPWHASMGGTYDPAARAARGADNLTPEPTNTKAATLIPAAEVAQAEALPPHHSICRLFLIE